MNSVITKIFDFPQEPICHTCKNKIEFLPFRNVFLEGRVGISQVLFFHYFFPCWDIDYIVQKYPNTKINHVGFTFEPDCLPDKKTLYNYKKNIQLWIEDGY